MTTFQRQHLAEQVAAFAALLLTLEQYRIRLLHDNRCPDYYKTSRYQELSIITTQVTSLCLIFSVSDSFYIADLRSFLHLSFSAHLVPLSPSLRCLCKGPVPIALRVRFPSLEKKSETI